MKTMNFDINEHTFHALERFAFSPTTQGNPIPVLQFSWNVNHSAPSHRPPHAYHHPLLLQAAQAATVRFLHLIDDPAVKLNPKMSAIFCPPEKVHQMRAIVELPTRFEALRFQFTENLELGVKIDLSRGDAYLRAGAPALHSRYTTAATPPPLHNCRYTTAATPLPNPHILLPKTLTYSTP